MQTRALARTRQERSSSAAVWHRPKNVAIALLICTPGRTWQSTRFSPRCAVTSWNF